MGIKSNVAEDALITLRRRVFADLARGDILGKDLVITDGEGMKPVVVALEDELLTTLIKRVLSAGGFANVFIGTDDGRIYSGSFFPASDAIDDEKPVDFGSQAIHSGATVGMFVAWATQHEDGVRFRVPASDTEVQEVRELTSLAS